ncbi:hypothetical protein [Thermococcus siculi]|uniref:hypothetical protein n=1 Tax=Thermococcus siculi TaxID=72803 RepID=UPI0012FE0007|nr:hypothetical protein [Thermococcus siculi]
MTIKAEIEANPSSPEKFRELIKKYSREFKVGFLGRADAKELMKLREEVYDL